MVDHDVIVVGAGALGAATAWHAARLGADVLLVDRGAVCSGTSPRGAGLVNRLLADPLDIGMVAESIAAFRELSDATGRAFTYHDPGGLLFVGEDQLPALDRLHRVWKAQTLDVLELAAGELAQVPGGGELRLGPDERAFLIAGDGWCVTTDAVNAMVDQAREHGATVRTDTPVERAEDGAVVLAGGQRLTAGAVVVAAGAWTRELLSPTWHVPLGVYRPQACALSLDHPDAMPVVHDAVHHTYWRPEGSGKLVVGDGTVLEPQDPSGEPPVEPGFPEDAAAALARRWPRAKQAGIVAAWAGFEAGTPDQRPLVGPVPGTQHLHVLAGGNGFGFMRSPALGEAAARLALGRAPQVPITGYRADRFDWGAEHVVALQEGFSLTRG